MKAKKFKALAIEIAEQMNDGGIEKDRRTLENLGIAVAEYIKPDLRFDNSYAVAEGWDLFDVDTPDGPAKQIQKNDENSPFKSDAEAIAFVRRLANAGSKYHADAIGRDLRLSKGAEQADTKEYFLIRRVHNGQRLYWYEPLNKKPNQRQGWVAFDDATRYVESYYAHNEANRIMREANDYTMQITICTESSERGLFDAPIK